MGMFGKYKMIGRFPFLKKEEKELPEVPKNLPPLPRSKQERLSAISSLGPLNEGATNKPRAQIVFVDGGVLPKKNYDFLSDRSAFNQRLIQHFIKEKDEIKNKTIDEIKDKIEKNIAKEIQKEIVNDLHIEKGMKLKEVIDVLPRFKIKEMADEIYKNLVRSIMAEEINSKKIETRYLMYKIFIDLNIPFFSSDERAESKKNYLFYLKKIIFDCIEKGESSVFLPKQEKYKDILEILSNELLDKKIVDSVQFTQERLLEAEALEITATKELNMFLGSLTLDDIIKRRQAILSSKGFL